MQNKDYYEEVKKLMEKHSVVFPTDKERDDCIREIIKVSVP